VKEFPQLSPKRLKKGRKGVHFRVRQRVFIYANLRFISLIEGLTVKCFFQLSPKPLEKGRKGVHSQVSLRVLHKSQVKVSWLLGAQIRDTSSIPYLCLEGLPVNGFSRLSPEPLEIGQKGIHFRVRL
jgi:hypothetical protein